MLFHSLEFLYIFLPITWIGLFLAGHLSRSWAPAWLAIASVCFYARWSIRDLCILLASAAFNYLAGLTIGRLQERGKARLSKALLIAALAANLALLAAFKYTNFAIGMINSVAGTTYQLLNIALPLGISFFTFTQIAYLVDTHRKPVRYSPIRYLLFVTFFPHLIAGPIFHHKEMMPQFAGERLATFDWGRVAIGFTIFGIGLFKKVVLADTFGPYADAAFGAPPGTRLSFFEAWAGTIAYTLQIYFDFSGYSDMAIGLARIFGVRLPLNFWSPYKALSMIDFWRRWHITLSRFLRDYLYVPLGGNRRGTMRQITNLFITMLLGGIWHGAGWTFLAWGTLHGAFLVVNHLWRRWGPVEIRSAVWYRVMSWTLTFLCVSGAWVFFRAASISEATNIFASMAGLNGITRPAEVGLIDQLFWNKTLPSGWGEAIVYLIAGLAICLLLPNIYEVMRRYRPALNMMPSDWLLQWKPTVIWAAASAGLTVYSILLIAYGRPAAFLYFQF